MRIVRYIAEHKFAYLIVVLCFVIQAFCDLSLPNYTSNIVDVGIQQYGVEDAATSTMTTDSFETVALMLTDEDEATLRASYNLENGVYVLNDAGKENRAQLDEMLTTPMAVLYYAGNASSTGDASSNFDLSALRQAYAAGLVTKADIQQMMNTALESFEGVSDTVLSQAALAQAKVEYEAVGVSTTDMQMDYLVHMGLSMLGLALIAFLIHCVMNFFATRTATKIARDLRERFFRRVLSFSAAEVDQFSAASLITRGTNDIQLIQMMCLMGQRMVTYTPILCIGGIIMITQLNVSMGWIIALAVVLILVVMIIIFALAMPKFKRMQTLIDKVNLTAREMLTGLPVVRAFNRESFETKRFDKANTKLFKTQLFTNRAMSFMMPIMMLIMNGTSALIVWVGGHYVDLGTVQTGDLIAFITYSMIIVSSFLMIGMIAIMIPRANVAAQRIDEVLATSSSIEDALAVYDEQLDDEASGVRVEFRNVNFSYSDDAENVLQDVSFVAEAGKTTAIIGSTGCGKSTIVKLIERFYDVTEGAVLVDGVDVRQLSQEKLHATFGYVPQASFLFSGTIESNVGYGQLAGEEDAAAMQQAVEVAQAADFVAAKPEGMQSVISQGGTNVSGGQRQRLAIARALATKARGYLFDDSFSALDYKTDAKLRSELNTKLAGKTVIIVAQRVSTIMHADHIIVLDEGRIAGQGTHRQLLETCDTYKEIASSQLSEEELAKGGDAA